MMMTIDKLQGLIDYVLVVSGIGVHSGSFPHRPKPLAAYVSDCTVRLYAHGEVCQRLKNPQCYSANRQIMP